MGNQAQRPREQAREVKRYAGAMTHRIAITRLAIHPYRWQLDDPGFD